MKRQAKVLAVLLMMFVVLVGQSSAQEMGRYIVTVTIQGPAEQAVIRAGGIVDHVFDIIPAIAIRIPDAALPGLERNPLVISTEVDGMVWALQEELPWGIDRIDAELVHPDNKGIGVDVAIIDTGIDLDHADLAVAGNVTFVEGTTSGDDDADRGHGTHVAGIVAALDNEIGVIGVAPEASLYAVKVLDSSGSGYVSDVIAGINWSANNGMEVINMSLGGGYSESLETACNAADAAGIVLVAAAGNSGNPPGMGDNIGYPAAYESVIAVGATDISDNRASFSSTGSALELMAPGVSINSTVPGGYDTKSGTSMACPHVAGVAALAIAAADVRGTLVATADDLGDPGWDPKYGYGLVDAAAAAGVSEGPQSPVANAGSDQTVSDVDGNGEETVTLNGSASYDPDGTIDSYEWKEGTTVLGTAASITFNFAVGVHIVTLTVTDDDGLTDTDDIIITVTEPAAIETMHVASIEMDLSIRKAGPNTFTRAVAAVTIVDASDAPVAGATVYGFWSDATSDTDSGVTDSAGNVTLESDAVKNASSGTTFTFTVFDVVKSGWTYEPGAIWDGSKTVP